jgi:hypothetical protein
MTAKPLGLLVGITRLIAVYFALRSIDQLTGGIFAYSLQRTMSYPPEIARMMPSVFAVYAPAFLLFLTLTVAVWFAAPAICRFATKEQPAAVDHDGDAATAWSPVMIFLTGTLFLAWGITRLAEDLTPYFNARATHVEFVLNAAIQIHLTLSVVLIGFGAIFMSRFAAIQGWIQARAGNPPAPRE